MRRRSISLPLLHCPPSSCRQAAADAANAAAANAAAEAAALAAAATAVPHISSQLPPGWLEATDPGSGRSYYVNMQTGTTQWEPPVSAVTHHGPHYAITHAHAPVDVSGQSVACPAGPARATTACDPSPGSLCRAARSCRSQCASPGRRSSTTRAWRPPPLSLPSQRSS